ncbi:hypothetical protein TVAG_283620 [Trichomonas vaginalis G3]|uniref:Uncharacterized protein n=1 Tax=Trichomonas vaginalis (strain ATCC PRA-98 / G3) TaxID=412133 RepID=A2DER6_TRIV3|nr:hypothetical protein TVAGG3_0576940 [Trichomonas vaginalis G3]EAY21193.1 hypothetical protein TVAG_283620 [Trichomonas vaginalis G3]KAI5522277.1 hypothetical protein TVAGG3_0576940 [Trichomonas vaginalis G3]|eukprot:XP_001582179.1 hypothetical protein [Trichomonas vaginalis G3]
MLLLLLSLTRSIVKNYDIPSVFKFGQNMLDGTKKTFSWKSGLYVGTNDWPFKPGYYHNYQWLDNYHLGFLADGFTFFVIAAVIFLVCSIFGFISYYCFNDKRSGKSKCICILALVFMFLTTILVISCIILVVVASADKVSMDQSASGSPMSNIYQHLTTVQTSFASGIETIGSSDNTRNIYQWMNNFETDLNRADTARAELPNISLEKTLALKSYTDNLKALDEAYNAFKQQFEANTNGIQNGPNLVNSIYGYEQLNYSDLLQPLTDRKETDQMYLDGVCSRTNDLIFLQNSLNEYITMHQKLKGYVKSLTDSILVLNSRGVPAMKNWVDEEFSAFVDAFKVTDNKDTDSFGNHMKSYDGGTKTFLIVSIIGAVLAIGGLVMIIVFVLAPKMNIAIAAFICGIGFMILCFGIGASFGTTNFYISSDDHLNNSFSDKNASDKNQFAYYNIFVCPYDSIIESFNYLETQTEESFPGFISSYIHYSNYTDQIGQLITEIIDKKLLTVNNGAIPFYVGTVNNPRYNASYQPRSPPQTKQISALDDTFGELEPKDGNNFEYTKVLTAVFTYTSSPFVDLKDTYEKVKAQCSINGKDVAEVKAQITSCKDNVSDEATKTAVNTIESNAFFRTISSKEDYKALYYYVKNVHAFYQADNSISSTIRKFFAQNMNKVHNTLVDLYNLNRTYIQPNVQNGTAWYKFDSASKQITTQSCAKLAEQYSDMRESVYEKSANYIGSAAMLGLFALIAYVISMLFAVFFKLSWGNRMSKDTSSGSYSYSSKADSKKKKEEEKKKEKDSDSSSFSEEAPRLSQHGMASQRGLASQRPSTQRGMASQRGLASNRGFAGVPPSRGGNRGGSSSSSSSYT